jgi:hypothetical protein
MSCGPTTSTYLNIKDLPELTNVITGDFLIVETPAATSILDFKNFIITLDNTTFGSVISGQSSDIQTLSSTVSTNYNTLSSSIDTLNTFIDTLCSYTYTSIDNLSSSFTTSINQLSSDINNQLTSNAFVTFNIPDYTNVEISPLKQKNIFNNITVNTTTSACTITFISGTFTDAYYCFTTGIYSSTATTYISIQNITSNSITLKVLDKTTNLPALADRVCIQVNS